MLAIEFAFFAALTASHLCFLADRVALHRSVRGNSHCDACARELRLRDVIPVLPWLLRRGRSACCASPVSPRYSASEALSALWAAAWALTVPGVPLVLAALLALLAPLVSATRSYRAAMRRAGLDCSARAHAAMDPHSPAAHTYLGALRCGWCASRLPSPVPTPA